MEDKQKICDLLLPTLQATRYLDDLKNLEYDSVQEVVLATFANGYQKMINVAASSGIGMIRDITKRII